MYKVGDQLLVLRRRDLEDNNGERYTLEPDDIVVVETVQSFTGICDITFGELTFSFVSMDKSFFELIKTIPLKENRFLGVGY